jgi:dynein heavy chain 1, cytosolic
MFVLTGEFHLRLRQLEKSLLQALNDAKGKILDDDSVIATLETLKKEADDIGLKVICLNSDNGLVITVRQIKLQ